MDSGASALAPLLDSSTAGELIPELVLSLGEAIAKLLPLKGIA